MFIQDSQQTQWLQPSTSHFRPCLLSDSLARARARCKDDLTKPAYIHTQTLDRMFDQLLRAACMASSNLSYFAPVTSPTTLFSFRILKVGTTLMPNSFANVCKHLQKPYYVSNSVLADEKVID